MGKSQDLLESFSSKLSVSRRSFVKGAIAAGTIAATYGCSKSDDSEVIFQGGGKFS